MRSPQEWKLPPKLSRHLGFVPAPRARNGRAFEAQGPLIVFLRKLRRHHNGIDRSKELRFLIGEIV